jgi:hypothetical protein
MPCDTIFIIRVAKLVQTEDKAKKKHLFLWFVEVPPHFDIVKVSANRRQSKEKTPFSLVC